MCLTCDGVHGLSAVVGALRRALAGGQPPCGAAGEVHVGAPGSRPPQAATRVEHPPDVPHATGFVVRMAGVKERHGEREFTSFFSVLFASLKRFRETLKALAIYK